MANKSKYFADEEFTRCSPPCSIEDMDADFLALMDAVRALVGEPLMITSAARTPEWELANGRTGSGAHTLGLAVDFFAGDSRMKYKIVTAALSLGVTRIGVGTNFVHIDKSTLHDQEVLWTY